MVEAVNFSCRLLRQVIDYPRSNKDLITAQNNADINQIADLIKVSSKANKSSK